MTGAFRKGLAGLLAFTLVAGTPGIGFAQVTPDCSCVTPLPPNQSVVGSIVDFEGNVMVTGVTGLERVGELPAPISLNAELTTGSGSAVLSIGECNLELSSSLRVRVLPAGENICVRVEPEVTGTQLGDLAVPAALIGVGVGAILFFSLGQDEPVSR